LYLDPSLATCGGGAAIGRLDQVDCHRLSDDRLAELYRRYAPIIYGRCRSILRDATAAEDATQETFIRVCRHLDKAPDSREALAWIYRIATNYCLNELRDRKHRPELRDTLPERGGAHLEVMLADRDLASRLIQRASEKLRVVAWLCHVDGLHQGEVAEVLGITRRTVINRLAEFEKNAQKFVVRAAG